LAPEEQEWRLCVKKIREAVAAAHSLRAEIRERRHLTRLKTHGSIIASLQQLCANLQEQRRNSSGNSLTSTEAAAAATALAATPSSFNIS